MLHQISLEQVLQKSDIDYIKEMAINIDNEFCQLLYEIAMNAYSKFNIHPNPKEALEICLLRMLTFNPLHKLAESSSDKPIEEKKNLKKDNSKEKKLIKTKSNQSDRLIASNEDWVNFFNTTKMSPFARNYFGNTSFKDFNNGVMTLIVNSESAEIPENILLEFKTILKESFSKEVEVNFEVGTVIDSPLEVKDVENTKKYNEAQSSIKGDKDIQNFINKFNGKIKEDTIKPIK
jgi:DNA polymerase III subunits gamma and tau domain III.